MCSNIMNDNSTIIFIECKDNSSVSRYIDRKISLIYTMKWMNISFGFKWWSLYEFFEYMTNIIENTLMILLDLFER